LKNDTGSSSGRSSATPAERYSFPAWPSGRDETALRIRLYSWSASSSGRLGQYHGELVAADPARNVRRADDVAHALGRFRQRGISRQVPDPVVDLLEVVEVEDDSASFRS
jgi:hypothetical protein